MTTTSPPTALAAPCPPPSPKIFKGHTSNIRSAAFLQDGKRALTASWDGTVRIWDVEKGCQIGKPLVKHNSYMLAVAVSPNGTRIASGGGNEVFVSDAADGRLIFGPMKGHRNWLNWLCFSPDGKRLASGSDDRTIIIWDVTTGVMLVPPSPIQAHFAQVRSVSFSPDGQKIVTASNDNSIQIWDADTGSPIQLDVPITRHENGITCALWTGNQIISCSTDAKIGFWESDAGEQIGDFSHGHTAAIWSIGIAPCGKYLASASFDGTVRLWDTTTHEQIGPSLPHGDEVYCVAFSPDGKFIISGGHDSGNVYLWDVGDIVRPYLDAGKHEGRFSSSNQLPDTLEKKTGAAKEAIRNDTRLKPDPVSRVVEAEIATRPLPETITPPDAIADNSIAKYLSRAWDKASKLWRRT